MNVNSRRAVGVIVGANFSDPTNERLIYLSAAGLVVVGVALFIGTAVWWRRGRQEHPVLSPLEVMGERRWAKASESDRRRRLDHVRLAGAGAAANPQIVAEPVDLEALVRSVPQAFDDLREPDAVVARLEPLGPDGDAVEVEQPEAAEPADDAVVFGGDAGTPDIAEPALKNETPAAADDDGIVADPDATSVSTERPADPLAVVVSVGSSASDIDGTEAVVPAPVDPLKEPSVTRSSGGRGAD